jgi:hypothetical protein
LKFIYGGHLWGVAVRQPLRVGYHLQQGTLRSKALVFGDLALPCGCVTGSCVRCGGV